MGKIWIGVLAFAGGAVVGGAFVAWYASSHWGQLTGQEIGAKIFGQGTTGAKITQDLFGLVDSVRS